MRKVKLGELWEESKIVSENPDSDKRIKVKLNVNGVEKRPDKNDKTGATKYFKRRAGQFIYGKQNLHKGAFGIIPEGLDEHESSSDIPSFDIVEECNPEWIYYYFKQGNFYKELEQYSKGTGSKRIHPDKIAHLEIPLPLRKEQDKIIEKIKLQENIHSKLDDEIDYQKTFLPKLKQSILTEAVQGKLVPQNLSDESAIELLKKIKKEKEKLIKEKKIKKGKELPPIEEDEMSYKLPKGWVWCRLGDVFSTSSGGTPSRSNLEYWGGKIPWLKSGELNDNLNINTCSEFITDNGLKNSSAKIFGKGNLIMALYGATAGKLGILGFDTSTNQAICCFYKNKFIDNMFLFYFLRSQREKILSECFGAAQPNISQDYIKKYLFPLPPLAEQHRIVEKVDALVKFCYKLELKIKENKEGSERLMGSVLGGFFGN